MDLTGVYLAGTKASDVALIHERLTHFLEGQRLINSPSLSVTNKQDARDLAATSQHVFEQITLALVRRLVVSAPDTQGIVLSGGCALNVKFSALVVEEFSRQRVFISSAPGEHVQMPGGARNRARTHARARTCACDTYICATLTHSHSHPLPELTPCTRISRYPLHYTIRIHTRSLTL